MLCLRFRRFSTLLVVRFLRHSIETTAIYLAKDNWLFSHPASQPVVLSNWTRLMILRCSTRHAHASTHTVRRFCHQGKATLKRKSRGLPDAQSANTQHCR